MARKLKECWWCVLAGIVGSTVAQAQTPAALIYDSGVGAISFAAGDLKAALVQNGYSVTDLPLGDPSGATQSVRIILTTQAAAVPGMPSPPARRRKVTRFNGW